MLGFNLLVISPLTIDYLKIGFSQAFFLIVFAFKTKKGRKGVVLRNNVFLCLFLLKLSLIFYILNIGQLIGDNMHREDTMLKLKKRTE